jgi:hypothetical protein
MLTKFGSTLDPGGGFITVDFHPYPPPGAMDRIQAILAKKGMTRTRVSERSVAFAGRSGSCVESIEKIGERVLDEIARANDFRYINCWFGDVAVTFMGTADLKDDFYRIIQSAEQVQRKN